MNGNVMEGITILNEITVSGQMGLGIFAISLGILGVILCVVGSILLFCDENVAPAIVLLLIMMVFGLVLCRGVEEVNKPTETHYQVIIDDSVPMNEFFERYEVIEQNGKIYTVRERNG